MAASTPFWLRKMKTYFKRIDFDQDGCITRNDFTQMADMVISKGQLSEDQKAELKKNLTAVWDNYLMKVASISMDSFVESMKKVVKDEDLKDVLKGPLPLFFHSVDANNDQMISKDEYQQFFETIGIGKSHAPASFAAIDDNHDEQISLDEFLEHGSKFFTEEAEGNLGSTLFWGPLEKE